MSRHVTRVSEENQLRGDGRKVKKKERTMVFFFSFACLLSVVDVAATVVDSFCFVRSTFLPR